MVSVTLDSKFAWKNRKNKKLELLAVSDGVSLEKQNHSELTLHNHGSWFSSLRKSAAFASDAIAWSPQDSQSRKKDGCKMGGECRE